MPDRGRGARARVRRRLDPRVAPSGGRIAAVWCRLAALVARGSRRQEYHDRLPGALDEVARSLRSGASVPQALAEAAATGDDPVRVDLARVVERVSAGQELGRALEWWRRDAPDPAVGLPVAALTLTGEGGGSRARAVDQVAATLRERLVLRAELRALSSQATLSAAVLVVSPFVFAALTAMVDGRVVSFLFGSPLGWLCLLSGLALDGVGAWWMARIVRGPW